MSLRGRLLPAAGWTAVSAFTRAGLHLLQVAVLARFLDSEDFGLMAMTGIMLGLGHLFSDFGLGSAYIQRQSVSERERSSLYWLNLVGGVGLAALLSLCSPLLARFFNEPQLVPLICLSSLVFPIQACGQQLRMHAEKRLAFGRIGRIEVLAAFLGMAAGVLAAWDGWGVYALVLSTMIVALAETLLAWLLLADGWRPQRHFDMQAVRPFLNFGIGLVGSNLMSHLTLTIDIFIGGHFFPAAQLGLYSVPRNLLLQAYFVTNPIVTRVGFPLMSRMQNSAGDVRMLYLAAVGASLAMNAPIYVACVFFAEEIVAILLGPAWGGAVQYMQILALWGLMRSIGNPVGSLLASQGRTGLAFRWNCLLLFGTVPILMLGASFSLSGLAWAMLSCMCLLWLPVWHFLIRPACGLDLGTYAVACVRPILFASLAVAAGYAVSRDVTEPIQRLLLGMLVTIPVYGALTWKFNRQWWLALGGLR